MSNNEPRIYLLPNLMTAGNLFCGFGATLKILEGAHLQLTGQSGIEVFQAAILFILGAFIFDFLDGRVARMGGNESPFGREFDSLADVVSFGVAPALLIYRIVLLESPKFGWLVASIYLICGALRLARFNCVAAAQGTGGGKEFTGFPIPAAAGVISSLTLFLLWIQAGSKEIGPWRYVLPALMLFLSFMMFSKVKYPSFKGINWRTKKSVPAFIIIMAVLAFTWMNYEWMLAVLFLSYLLYGFFRPWLSLKWRKEIEEEDEELVEENVDEPKP